MNSVAFAPHELGLMLAAASSDGSISILTYQEGAWTPNKVCSSHCGEAEDLSDPDQFFVSVEECLT